MLLGALELLAYVALLYIALTQVVLPLFRGTPLFPLFHSGERKLEQALADANEEVLSAALQKKVEERRAEAEKIRSAGK